LQHKCIQGHLPVYPEPSAILDLNLTGALTDQKEGMEGALVTQLAPVQLQDLECEASPKMFSLPVIIVNPAASLQA